MKNEIKRIYKEFRKIFMLPEMQVLPGQLAFYIIMSFVPILAICTIIVSHFIESFNLTNLIYTYFPDNLASIIIPFCTFAVYFERERLQKISDDTTESGCFRMIERSIDMPSGCYDANSLLR